MSDSFVDGWKAARLHYQNTGGVPPYPPGYEAALEKSVNVERKPVPKSNAQDEPVTQESSDG